MFDGQSMIAQSSDFSLTLTDPKSDAQNDSASGSLQGPQSRKRSREGNGSSPTDWSRFSFATPLQARAAPRSTRARASAFCFISELQLNL